MSHRHLYLRDYTKPNKHPVGCVVVEVDEAANQIRYAFSACSPLDKFSSKVARDKAAGRLIQSPTVLEGNAGAPYHDVMRRVMEHIVQSNSQQGRNIKRSSIAYVAAQAWLTRAQNVVTESQQQQNAA